MLDKELYEVVFFGVIKNWPDGDPVQISKAVQNEVLKFLIAKMTDPFDKKQFLKHIQILAKANGVTRARY